MNKLEHKLKKETVYIITVNWNNANDTLDFLDSLKNLRPLSSYQTKTLVIDNGSSDNSVEILSTKFPKVELIRSKRNLGFTGGYNLGIKFAIDQGADYVFIVNNDTLIQDPQMLTKLINIFEDDKKVGLVTPKIYFAPGFEFHKQRYSNTQKGKVIWYTGGIIDWANLLFSHRGMDEADTGQYDKNEETPFCTGCAIFTKASVLKKVGLFDNKYFAYLEDADLNMRVKRAGYKLIYAGDTFILHKTSRSSGGSGSVFHDYFMSRNRLIFGTRYAPLRTKIALLREAFKLLFTGREFQKLGIYDYLVWRNNEGSFFKHYRASN